MISYFLFDQVLKGVKLPDKILIKSRKNNYYKIILIFIYFLFMFMLEYVKQSLYEIYGKESWLSISFGGLLAAIYLNSIPYLFRKKD